MALQMKRGNVAGYKRLQPFCSRLPPNRQRYPTHLERHAHCGVGRMIY